MNVRSFLLSGFISGIITSLLSNLPLISFCNCLLCIWVWGGSILAVFLYTRFARNDPRLTIGQGLLLGLYSGVVATIIGIGLAAIFAPLATDAIKAIIAGQPDVAEAVAPYTELLEEGGSASVIGFFINLFTYSIFGMVGGVLGALIFKGRQKTVEGAAVSNL